MIKGKTQAVEWYPWYYCYALYFIELVCLFQVSEDMCKVVVGVTLSAGWGYYRRWDGAW